MAIYLSGLFILLMERSVTETHFNFLFYKKSFNFRTESSCAETGKLLHDSIALYKKQQKSLEDCTVGRFMLSLVANHVQKL